jgi:hypothetical protein
MGERFKNFSPESNDPIFSESLPEHNDNNLNESKESSESNDLTEWAKDRANSYLEQGKLKEAIDSMVSDLGKDPNKAEEQKDLIRMMGMTLRNDPELNEEKIREFIDGF